MPSTVVVAVKEALVDLLAAHADLENVQVVYGWPGDDQAEDEVMFCADARSTGRDFKIHSGRRRLDEEATFDLLTQVAYIGGSPQDVETRALALGDVVEDVVGADPTLGGVTGLKWARVDAWTLACRYNDTGSIAELRQTIRYSARLGS